MNKEQDEWGRDPSVQRTRDIFSDFEKAQDLLMKKINLSFLDDRLRNVRDTAKDLFEKSCSRALSKGYNLDHTKSVDLYLISFAQALCFANIQVPKELLPENKILSELINEVTP